VRRSKGESPLIKPLALGRDRPPNLRCRAGSSGMRFWWVNQNQTFAQETAGGLVTEAEYKRSPQSVLRVHA